MAKVGIVMGQRLRYAGYGESGRDPGQVWNRL